MADETEENREGRRSLLAAFLQRYLEGKLGPLADLAEASFAEGEGQVQDRRMLLRRIVVGAMSAAIETKEEPSEQADDPVEPDADQPAKKGRWIEDLLGQSAEEYHANLFRYIDVFFYGYESMRNATAPLHTVWPGAEVDPGRGMMSPDFLTQLDPSTLSKEQVDRLVYQAEKLQANMEVLSEARYEIIADPLFLMRGQQEFFSVRRQEIYVADVREMTEETVTQLEKSDPQSISHLSGIVGGKLLSGREYYIETAVEAAEATFRRVRVLLGRRPDLLERHIKHAERGLGLWQQIYTAWLELQKETAMDESGHNTSLGAEHYRPGSRCNIEARHRPRIPVRDVVTV